METGWLSFAVIVDCMSEVATLGSKCMLVPVAFTGTCLLSFAAGLKNVVATVSVSLTLLKYVGCLLPSAFNMDCMS